MVTESLCFPGRSAVQRAAQNTVHKRKNTNILCQEVKWKPTLSNQFTLRLNTFSHEYNNSVCNRTKVKTRCQFRHTGSASYAILNEQERLTSNHGKEDCLVSHELNPHLMRKTLIVSMSLVFIYESNPAEQKWCSSQNPAGRFSILCYDSEKVHHGGS